MGKRKWADMQWADAELKELIDIYRDGFLCGDGKLDNFCKRFNRLKSNVCRKAKKLGLVTDRNRYASEVRCEEISEAAKIWIAEKGHPRGMSGKTHSDEEKKRMSLRTKKMWADPNAKVNSLEHRQAISDRMSKQLVQRLIDNPGKQHSKSKKGIITIGTTTFFARSTWEANIGAYFEFLKQKGEIKNWVYEPTTFWFEKIKRGVRSYKPDFLITKNDGTQYFEEVKGWMDPKSVTKLKRMKKYYPHIEVRVLGEDRYKAIKKMSALIPEWGKLDGKNK